MALTGHITSRREINNTTREEMYQLMNLHYDNVDQPTFNRDLDDKEWVLLLTNPAGELKGFTTLMILDLQVDGQTVKGIFSGDTIIHRDYWGETELQRTWANFVITIAHTQYADYPVYWLLLSKGYKTYRYLPIYFHTFYPRCDQPTPAFEQQLMDQYAHRLFPESYDPATGVAHNQDQTNYFLKGELASIPENKLRKPDIRFFAAKNPGYLKGDELVCIASLKRENLRPAIFKLLEGEI